MDKFNSSQSIEKKFVIPSFKDPRWPVLAALLSFSLVLINDPAFGKTIYQLLAAVITSVSLDLFINIVIKKRYVFPLSAMSTAVGMTLIIFSPHIWPFVVIPLFAALSKSFIRYKNIHVFNPNNCGMVLAFLFLGSAVSTTYGRWMESPILFGAIVVIGFYISHRAHRLDMSLSFLASFILFALFRGVYLDITLTQALLPLTNAIYFIFTFYHMTDPITTPKNRRGRIIFGLCVGLVDNLLRVYEIRYSPFLALFFMAAIQPMFEKIFHRDYEREQWRMSARSVL